MNNKSLCDSCMYAGSCADSDKGLSFANHTICWKYVEDKQETENYKAIICRPEGRGDDSTLDRVLHSDDKFC